jgi:5-formyltetrahydrofolate cyclo-ligase
MPLSKTSFRQNCIKKLNTEASHNKLYRDSKLNFRLQRELKKIKNKKILFYLPMAHESDITKTIKIFRKKCDIFTPFMFGQSFKMVPFRLPLKKKKFGIYEAGNTLRDIKKIDIAIVPVVGVDGNLQRIGFGKGMYDRFFAKLKKKPYIIFIQTKMCYTKEFICDDYDIACDVLITPDKRVQNRGK